jgi:hypothetical protein
VNERTDETSTSVLCLGTALETSGSSITGERVGDGTRSFFVPLGSLCSALWLFRLSFYPRSFREPITSNKSRPTAHLELASSSSQISSSASVMPRPIRPRRTTRSSGKAQETQEEVVLPTLSRRKKRQVSYFIVCVPKTALRGGQLTGTRASVLLEKVTVLPPITTQGPLYKTVAISDECSTSPARAVSARRIPIHDQDDILRRTETRNVILQNYDDAKVDCLDTRELLDLLQNCMAVFDLSPTDRIALFSKLTLIDATLANASMHTPPPTPIRNKQTQHKEKKKKRRRASSRSSNRPPFLRRLRTRSPPLLFPTPALYRRCLRTG